MSDKNVRVGTHIENEILFSSRHPELSDYLPELQGTYARCQKTLPEDLELALKHLDGCTWCREEFEHLKQSKDKFRK